MTAHRNISTLRFEEAEISFGDELRGARASSGRSLDQIERELKIKAAYLLAIEDARPDLLPDPAYAAGFVRAYARFLGLDQEKALARFQKEVEGPAKTPSLLARAAAPLTPNRTPESAVARRPGEGLRGKGDPLAGLSRNHNRGKVWRGLLGGIAMLAPLAFAGGILWGGWKLMDHAGVAAVFSGGEPTPASVTVSLPSSAALERPSAAAYENRVEAYWGAASASPPPPALPPIDAPLASALARLQTPPAALPGGAAPAVGGAAPAAGGEAPAAAAPVDPSAPAFALVAERPVWMEIREAVSGKVVFSGTLEPGGRFTPPEGAAEPLRLARLGNPSGLLVEVGGESLGSFANTAAAISSFDLNPAALRGRAALLAATPAAPAAPTPRPAVAQRPPAPTPPPLSAPPAMVQPAAASANPPPQRALRPAAETRVVSSPPPVYTHTDAAAPGGRPFGSMRPVE